MCGIAGILTSTPDDRTEVLVRKMVAAAAHRGPDDEGLVLFPAAGPSRDRRLGPDPGPWKAALGHRRLSIIDLSPAGHQPMSDPSGRYWIVFNGEVYNYLEIRRGLHERGVTFRSDTDTEVVLQAYLTWGADALGRCNGMWAFAIYDTHEDALFCARDRFGVKPFYYASAPGRFAFASEIKQLLVLPWVERRANRALLADFFLWGLETHTNDTFFEGISALPAAHWARIEQRDVEQGRIEPTRYWSPPADSAPLDPAEGVARFREVLKDAVRLRLRSDVPVGVTLSGGLDSSTVVCLAGEVRHGDAREPFQAFHVEYGGEGYTERRFAETAARRAGAEMVVLRPQAATLASDWAAFLWHMEQPVNGLSYFSNYQIYKLICAHRVPVILCGQGGDELLLGYERYRTYDLLFRLRQWAWGRAMRAMWLARRRGNLPVHTQLAYGIYFSLPSARAARRRRLTRPFLRREFYGQFAHADEHLRREAVHENRRSLQESEFLAYQLPHLLHHEDRMSMAHAIETRLPFLDYRLFELVLSLPDGLLIQNGWSKALLRRAMEGVLPEEIRWRTDKMGYETPTGALLRANRSMFLPLLERHTDDPVVDAGALARRFEDPGLDERLLCSVLTYLTWKEMFDVR